MSKNSVNEVLLQHVRPGQIRLAVTKEGDARRGRAVDAEMVSQGRDRTEVIITGGDDDGTTLLLGSLCPWNGDGGR